MISPFVRQARLPSRRRWVAGASVAGIKLEARFYETYEMCSVVEGVLRQPYEYARSLEGFHCDGQWAGWLSPFPKVSALHQFIDFVVHGVHDEQAERVDLEQRLATHRHFASLPAAISDLKPHILPIELAFAHHGIDHLSFVQHLADTGRKFDGAEDDDVYDYMFEIALSEAYEALMQQTVAEVFHVLFQNRSLLLSFNEYVSGILERSDPASAQGYDLSRLAKSGTLRRTKPPMWARRAVFFRDRGQCVLCERDLTGLVNLDNVENFDHIVPLALHGINDVSNLQLLCVPCNQGDKKAKRGVTSNRYQTWY